MDEAVYNIKTKGYHIIPNYLTKDECINVVKKMDEVYKIFDKKIACKFSENVGGDERLFGLENVNETAKKILEEPFFLDVLKKYMKLDTLHPSISLLGRLKHEPGVIKNSGGNWHRDSLHKQVKAIVYLTDVTEKNGNFQIISGTNVSQLNDKYGNRVGEENVKELLEKSNKKIDNLVAKRGTVILVDTSNIHRGNVMLEGERYSLTTYYFNDEHAGRKFISRVKENYITQ